MPARNGLVCAKLCVISCSLHTIPPPCPWQRILWYCLEFSQVLWDDALIPHHIPELLSWALNNGVPWGAKHDIPHGVVQGSPLGSLHGIGLGTGK